MPYNPGIQDISGQLLAQGMQARAQGIAGGVTTLFQGLQQNQMMTNQAIARFQAASAANPKLLDFLNKAGTEESPVPVNPDVLKAYSDIKSGKTNVQNTALLAQFADSYNQAEAAQQMQQMRQAQMQAMAAEDTLRKAQADKLQMEVGRMREENEFFKRLEAGGLTGQPATQPGPQATSAPAQIPYFLRRDVSRAPTQSLQTAAPQTTTAAAVAAQPSRPSAAVTSDDILQAKMSAGPGASMAQVLMTARANAAARAKEAPREGLYETQSLAQQDAQRLDADNPIPGYIRTVSYDPQAKAFVIKPVERRKSTQEEIDAASALELAKGEAAEATKSITAIKQQATNARDDITRLDRIDAALDSGIRTGFAAEALSGFTSALVDVGLYPAGKQATKEVLLSDVAIDSLSKTQKYMDGQGSVSNAERDRIDRIAQNARMQPEALRELVRIQRAVYNRQIAADEHRMALEDKYENDPRARLKVAREMERWWAKNTIGKFEMELKKQAGQDSAATQAATTEWNYDPKTGQYNPTSKP